MSFFSQLIKNILKGVAGSIPVMKKTAILYIICTLFIINISAPALKAGYHERGKSYYVYRKYDKAKEMFLKSVEKHERGDSYYFLGEIEKIQKNYKEAEKYFTKAAELSNTTRKYRKNSFWNLIVLAEQRGDLDEVVRVCKKMWTTIRDRSARQKVEKLINKFLWTENTEAIKLFKKGVAFKKRRKYDEAMKYFQEASSTDYSFLAPKFEMSLIYYSRKEYSSAASNLREVVSRISFYAEAHLMLGDIYYRNRSYSYARDHFIKALDFSFSGRSTRYHISLRITESAYAAGDYSNAKTYGEKAHKIKPGALKPLLIISAANIKLGEYDDALKFLSRARKLNPQNSDILYQIGSIYYRKNDWRHVSYFDRLYDTVSGSPKKKNRYSRAFKILAKSHFEKKNYPRTAAIIKSLAADNRSFELTLMLGKSQFHLKQYDAAADTLSTISLSSADAVYLCKAYALSGRRSRAKEVMKKNLYSSDFTEAVEKSRLLRRLKKEIDKEREREREESISPSPAQ